MILEQISIVFEQISSRLPLAKSQIHFGKIISIDMGKIKILQHVKFHPSFLRLCVKIHPGLLRLCLKIYPESYKA